MAESGASSAGELTPYGLGWRAILGARRVRVTATKLRRGSGGLKAYVEVDYARPKADGGGHLLLAGEWLNLGSGRDRASLANRLKERQNGVEWRNVLDAVCIEIQRRDDEGDPMVLIGNRPPPPDGGWLVQDFLERGQSHSLFGDGAVGKSWLALALAVSVASGLEIVPGYRPLRRGNTLYVDYETDWETLNTRVRQIANGAGIPPPDIAYLRLDQPFPDALERVLKICQEHQVLLVIVDSVEAAMAGSTEPGAAANEGPARMNQALRRLQRTSLLVDHVNAEQAKSRALAGRAYGSIFKRNWVRLSYEVKQLQEATSPGERHLGLFNVKRNNGPLFDPIGLLWTINDERSAWTREPIDVEGFAEAVPSYRRIEALLRDAGPQLAQAIAEQLGLSRGTVSSTLTRRTDLFERLPGGLWQLRQHDDSSDGQSPLFDPPADDQSSLFDPPPHDQPDPDDDGRRYPWEA